MTEVTVRIFEGSNILNECTFTSVEDASNFCLKFNTKFNSEGWHAAVSFM